MTKIFSEILAIQYNNNKYISQICVFTNSVQWREIVTTLASAFASIFIVVFSIKVGLAYELYLSLVLIWSYSICVVFILCNRLVWQHLQMSMW